MLDRHPVGVRAHTKRRGNERSRLNAAEHLRNLALDLRLLLTDVRNHVAEDVERRHPGIPRARNGLHRHREYLPDAERFVQRRERNRRDCGRAVGVGDDAARPAAAGTLLLEQTEMIRVHFRDDERDVRLHPEVLGVAEHERACLRKRRFQLPGRSGVERREHDRCAQLIAVARQ